MTVFVDHKSPDRTKIIASEVHEGLFMNKIDSFGTSEVTQVSMAIKYGVQVLTYANGV